MKILISIFLILGLSSTALAKKKRSKKRRKKVESSESYDVPWGMAGCGLWAGVIKEKDKNSQIAVWALRNVVLNSQTSAITSGTSNCVEQGAAYAQQEKEVFMTVNYASLSKEAARGQGAHLNAFSQILGCQDQDSFATFSQNNYEKIFTNNNPQKVLNNYLNEVKNNEKLSKQCSRLS